MVSTNQVKKNKEAEIIAQNDCYREVRVSTEHYPYGVPGTRELFANITYQQGSITLTRVSTTSKPKTFVLTNEEVKQLAIQIADFEAWQKRRNAAYEEARKLIQQAKLEHVLFLEGDTEDAELFSIQRSKQYGTETMLPAIHFDHLVQNAQNAIALVQAEKAGEEQMINVELNKLKEAGFEVIDVEEEGFLLKHPEFDYDPRLPRTVEHIQGATPKLLNKLEELRDAQVVRRSVQHLKEVGFRVKTASAQEIRLVHPDMPVEDVVLRTNDVKDVQAKTTTALDAFYSIG